MDQGQANDRHAHGAEDVDFLATLTRSTSALEERGIPYLVIGGLASELLGRERRTRDIDLFVKPDDAERVQSLRRPDVEVLR